MSVTATCLSLAGLCLTVLVSGLGSSAAADEPVFEQLWPGEAPGSEGVENTERQEDYRVFDVSVPALMWYPAPKDKATGTGIIVCPGGAFRRLAMNHEGHVIS